MATWTLSFYHALAGNLTAVFPSSMTFTTDETKDSFSHKITVKENNVSYDRDFTCTWQGNTKGEDLILTRDDSTNSHYYRGRIHKRTITRGTAANPISHTIVVGILGHKTTAYLSDDVGTEDNVVIFTGTT